MGATFWSLASLTALCFKSRLAWLTGWGPRRHIFCLSVWISADLESPVLRWTGFSWVSVFCSADLLWVGHLSGAAFICICCSTEGKLLQDNCGLHIWCCSHCLCIGDVKVRSRYAGGTGSCLKPFNSSTILFWLQDLFPFRHICKRWLKLFTFNWKSIIQLGLNWKPTSLTRAWESPP